MAGGGHDAGALFGRAVRGGRGESGDMAPYAIEREIEDLDALMADIAR